MLILKQSTSVDIRVGPFLDATDGVTPETGITLAGADQAEVLKANGAATVAMAGTFAAVTGSDGWYDYTVATGDVDTVGEVVFVVQDSSVCLPVFVRAQVVEEAVYDDLYGAGAAGYAGIAELATVDTNVDSVLVDTGTTLPATLSTLATAAALATVDSIVDDILVDTGTSIPAGVTILDAKIDALNDFDPTTDTVIVGSFSLPDGYNLELGITDKGTAAAVSATSLTTRAGQVNGSISIGSTIVAYSSTLGYSQPVQVVSVAGDVLTITAWPQATPTGTVTYVVFSTALTSTDLLPDVNVAKINDTTVLGTGIVSDKWRA